MIYISIANMESREEEVLLRTYYGYDQPKDVTARHREEEITPNVWIAL